jgi:hypothetical protein
MGRAAGLSVGPSSASALSKRALGARRPGRSRLVRSESERLVMRTPGLTRRGRSRDPLLSPRSGGAPDLRSARRAGLFWSNRPARNACARTPPPARRKKRRRGCDGAIHATSAGARQNRSLPQHRTMRQHAPAGRHDRTWSTARALGTAVETPPYMGKRARARCPSGRLRVDHSDHVASRRAPDRCARGASVTPLPPQALACLPRAGLGGRQTRLRHDVRGRPEPPPRVAHIPRRGTAGA